MMNRICGIYYIKNILNKKRYIGQSIDISKRLKEHKRRLNNNNHKNQHLQNSWNKHGEKKFKFGIIEICEKQNLCKKEQYYLNNNKNKYNICSIAGTTLNLKLSKETRRKMGNIRRGKKHSDSAKEKIRIANIGKIVSFKTRKKISDSRKGKYCGKDNPMFGKTPWLGKHHTEETKKKISEANKGKHCSEETRKKLSKIRKNNNRFNKENHPNSKLTLKQVTEIRKKYESGKFSMNKLAKLYNMANSSCIWKIIHNLIWRENNNE